LEPLSLEQRKRCYNHLNPVESKRGEPCPPIPSIFRIERFDDEVGLYYVVNGQEIALITEGDTLEEAIRHLREAVELYYEGNRLSELSRIEVILEVTPEYA
jgi:predicted RNase H-like HicB family nuclease